jgi:hypothetical protein
MTMAGERRVVTPDGHVWHVRRRWAKRRLPWSRRPGRPAARFDAEAELPTEEMILPPLDGLFSYSGNDLDHLGERSFARRHDERHAATMMVWALVVGFVAGGLLIAASVHYVLPWLLPLLVANARPILGVAAAVAVLAVLDCLQRPWFVALQRQGLSDAPRRVWRVQGWRQSRRLMAELATAVQEGRIDSERAAILFPGRGHEPPW